MIVVVNDFFLFFAADSGAPAVTLEKVGDAGHGIGMGHQVMQGSSPDTQRPNKLRICNFRPC